MEADYMIDTPKGFVNGTDRKCTERLPVAESGPGMGVIEADGNEAYGYSSRHIVELQKPRADSQRATRFVGLPGDRLGAHAIPQLWKHSDESSAEKGSGSRKARGAAQLRLPPSEWRVALRRPGHGQDSTSLAFFDWWPKHAKHKEHKPTLLLVPDGYVFRQWVETINEYFPDTNLVVAAASDFTIDHPEKKPGKYTSVTREAIENATMPAKLKYVFDTTDPRASKTLFISSYSAWRARVLEVKPATPTEVAKKEELGHIVRATYRNKKKKLEGALKGSGQKKAINYSNILLKDVWRGKLAMTMSDEGHNTRNPNTQTHWSVRHLEAPINWLLTATPIVNDAEDIAAQARMLWTRCFKDIQAHPDFAKVQAKYEAAKESKNPWEFWDWLQEDYEPDKTSTLRLLFLDPDILSAVIANGDLQLIAKHFQAFDELVALRRSRDSMLPLSSNPAYGHLSLREIMPEPSRTTITLKHAIP